MVFSLVKIVRGAIPVDLGTVDRIGIGMHTVRPIAFDGVDCAAVTAFDDADVIWNSVTVPVKEDYFPRIRLIVSLLPGVC